MKQKRVKLRILLILLILVPIPYACDSFNSYPTSQFNLESLALRISTFNQNSWVYIDESLTEDSITTNLTDIRLELIIDETSEVSMLNHSNFLINASYADPVPPMIVTEIDMIQISATNEIIVDGYTYSKGETINELFYAFGYFESETSINEFLNSKSTWYLGESVSFIFRPQIEYTIKTQLHLEIIMSDGKMFELETPPLKLL